MGRGDADARPPIEVVGADLGVGSTQQVAMGPHRPKPGRGRTLAIAAAVVALLVGGLFLGDSDTESESAAEEERDNQERIDLDKPLTSTTGRRTTTTRPTTTTTAPLGPPLGEPLEGAILITSPTGWEVVDLTTGAVRRVSLPFADPFSSVAVAGGVVAVSRGVANYYQILGSGEEPPARELGPADFVMRSGTDQVWLLDAPPDGGDDPSPHVEVRLVDLDAAVQRSFEVPGRWVERATESAVLVSRGGRVYAADGQGLRSIAVGMLTNVSGDAAVVLTCDEQASCELRRQPVDGSSGRRLLEVENPDTGYFEPFDGPDGRFGFASSADFGGSASIVLFGAEGESLGKVEITSSPFAMSPRWLPGDLGLLVGTGSGIEWIRPDGSGWQTSPIFEWNSVSGEAFFVITP